MRAKTAQLGSQPRYDRRVRAALAELHTALHVSMAITTAGNGLCDVEQF
jgi:hypothetical protein